MIQIEPNVNKTKLNVVNKYIVEAKLPKLVDIGSRNLHVVHNGFGKGLETEAKNLCLELYLWFKCSAARKEYFKSVQIELDLDKNFILRHVSCRWLSLQPAIARILEQWDAIVKYFTELPLQDKTVEKNEKYKLIRGLLDKPLTLVQLRFLLNVAPIFTKFLTTFQQEGPLVHVLHSELSNLVRMLMLRFVRAEAVGAKCGKQLKEIDLKKAENLRTLEDFDLGETTRQSLAKIKQEKHKAILLDMRNFYITTADYLRTKLPLSNALFEDLACLSPSARSQPCEQSFCRLAKALPHVVCPDEISTATDEWKLYSLDVNILLEWQYEETIGKEKGALSPVDKYWLKVLGLKNSVGVLKYGCLAVVVKACLSLPHGNADVERSFSANKRVVVTERASLDEDTICALRIVKEAIRIQADGIVSSNIVTPHLLSFARSVYSSQRSTEQEENCRSAGLEEKGS